MAINIKDLLTILNTTNTQKTDQKLYDFLRRLLDGVQQINVVSSATAAVISGGGGGGGGSSITNATYLTATNESGILPFSRELLAGTNVTFDDTTPNQRTVNVALADDYVVMSDGNTPTPSPMNDGNGNFLYITYTP